MKFSIIIAVRSINDYLRENITHLKELSYQNYEVIILLDKLENYDYSDNRFKAYGVGPIGPGEKRTIGATHSTGDILVFLDDDAYPSSDWLDEAAAIFKDPRIYALGAPAVTPLKAPFLERCSGYVLESWLTSAGTNHRHKALKRRFVNDYPTVNLFVRKEAFFEIGGFTKEFWPGEDTKLCLDLVKRFGRNFLYDPRPIVYHHRRTLFKPHLKQISRYGQHRGQFARIFPETSRVPSYFVPSLFVAGLFLGPVVNLMLPFLWPVYFAVVVLYFFLIIIESFRFAIQDKSFTTGFYVGFGIFLTHVVYGVNFIIGFIKKPKLKLKKVNEKTGNYAEG